MDEQLNEKAGLASFDEVKADILETTIKYLLLIILPALIVANLFLISNRQYFSAASQVTIYFIVLAIFLLRRILSFHLKIYIFGACILSMGLISYANFGLMSFGPVYFMSACVLLTVLVGGRRTYVFTAVCFSLLLLVVFLDSRGVFSPLRVDREAYLQHPYVWLNYILIVTYIILAVVIGLNRTNRFLFRSIRTLETRNLEMQEMVSAVSAADTELRLQNDELTSSRQRLVESEEKYRELVDNSMDMIYSVDAQTRITAVNRTFEDLMRLPRLNIIGREIDLLFSDEELVLWNECFSLVLETKKPVESLMEYTSIWGDNRIDHMTMVPILNQSGEILAVTCSNHDIRDLISKEQRIRYLEYNDPLTGLPNRASFKDRLSSTLEECRRRAIACAVFSLDLDGFKIINDSMGLTTGDNLIREISERLKNLGELDTLARIGPDEFGMLVLDVNREDQLAETAARIQTLIQEPWRYGEHQYNLSSCIGVAVYPGDGENAESLMQNADTAMNSAKAGQAGRVRFFESSMKVQVNERFKMELLLRDAIMNGEMEIHYQPQIEVKTNRVRGFEALMRWKSSQYGWVSPSRFIPILEEASLIALFDEWVLRNACIQTRLWHDTYGDTPIISVNVSAVEFMQLDFVEKVHTILQETRLAPSFLEIEITESILIKDFEYVVRKLRTLRAMGIRVALDDFGTGYSSLNYLRQLPIHTLKIDRAFVLDIQEHSGQKTILGSIIALSHDMELDVVAEGVETEEQMAYLAASGCDIVQGYYHYRPMDAASIARVLEKQAFPEERRWKALV